MTSTNIYIKKIQEISLQNKYTKWYCNIITNALSRASSRKQAKELLGYVESHHIVPRAFKLGGEDDKINFVHLTAKEHYLCHWLLVKMFNDNFKFKMACAFHRMCNQETKLQKRNNSKYYAIAKKYHSEEKSKAYLGKRRNKRNTISDEGLNILRENARRTSLINKNKSDEEKQIRNDKISKTLSERKSHPNSLLNLTNAGKDKGRNKMLSHRKLYGRNGMKFQADNVCFMNTEAAGNHFGIKGQTVIYRLESNSERFKNWIIYE